MYIKQQRETLKLIKKKSIVNSEEKSQEQEFH